MLLGNDNFAAGRGPIRRGDRDDICVLRAFKTLNVVPVRQEGVEALNQSRKAGEQRRDALDDSRGIDADKPQSTIKPQLESSLMTFLETKRTSDS